MMNWTFDNAKGNTLLKVFFLLLAIAFPTYILAQHYSGRHSDEYDGGGSGGFILVIIVVICIAIGTYLHFHLLDKDSSPRRSSSTPKEKDPMSVSEIYRREAERIDARIKQNEKESKEADTGCIAFLVIMGFFVFLALKPSCSDDSNANHSVNSPINTNNGNPLNKSKESTSNTSTDEKEYIKNDLNSILQHIKENESNPQTDNMRK